jgi:hypothetical protein
MYEKKGNIVVGNNLLYLPYASPQQKFVQGLASVKLGESPLTYLRRCAEATPTLDRMLSSSLQIHLLEHVFNKFSFGVIAI